MRACPAGAVTGSLKQPHVIDPEKCVACGSCREACRFEAVLTRGKKQKQAKEVQE